MSNSTLVSDVDNNMNAFEVALSEILGIPLDEEITAPIFEAINTDGTAFGALKFKKNGGTAAGAPGIEIEDSGPNGKKFRIVVVGGELWVYEWDTDDAPEVWTQINQLDLPVESVLQLDEFEGLDLEAIDEQVLQVDASDPDNIVFKGLSVAAAGALAFEDLSNVEDDIFDATEIEGYLVRVNETEDGLELIKPELATSPIEDIGDLADVYPTEILDANRGNVLAVGWEDLNTKLQVDYKQHVLGFAQYNQDLAVDGTMFVAKNRRDNATWDPIKISYIGRDDIAYANGLGLADEMFELESHFITLPEPGPYLIQFHATWRWNYEPAIRANEDGYNDQDIDPTIRRIRVRSLDSSSIGQCAAEGVCAYDTRLPGVGTTGLPLLDPDNGAPNDAVSFYPRGGPQLFIDGLGFWYAMEADVTICFEAQHYSNVRQDLQYMSIFIAKVR